MNSNSDKGLNLLVSSSHAVSLARPGLSIRQDSHVVPFEQLLHDLLDTLLVEVLVGEVRSEGVVVGERLDWFRVGYEDLII